MKKIKSFLLVFVLIILSATFIQSCKKEIGNIDENVSNMNPSNENIDLSNFKQEIVSYIDNVKIKSDLKDYPEILLIVERQNIDYNRKIITLERFGFTAEEGYINFGIDNNYPLKEEREFQKLMRKYIEENNIEEYYAKNGKLPDSYKEYEAKLYEEISPEQKTIPSLMIGLVFAKGPYGTGDHWIAWLKTWPVMLPGWNNAISSYQPIGLAGIVSFYDRTFYRNHLFTRVNWGMSWYNMFSANNRVSSWFRI